MHHLYCDGGSQNENQYAACAFTITDNDNKILYSNGVYLGAHSSNEAEYWGLILGLTSALAGGITELTVIQDSQLVSRHMSSQYKVKAPNLKPLYETARSIASKFTHITYTSVSREHPMIKLCDARCDVIIDLQKSMMK